MGYVNLMPTGELVRRAKARIIGYLKYYAVTDNASHCDLYVHLTRGILFKCLNRRSQLKSYTWEGFTQMLAHIGWPRVRIQPLAPAIAYSSLSLISSGNYMCAYQATAKKGVCRCGMHPTCNSPLICLASAV